MRSKCVFYTIAALAILWVAGVHSASAWEPAKARALIVGVLAWQDPSFRSFSKTDRKDQALYDLLLAKGVPQTR